MGFFFFACLFCFLSLQLILKWWVILYVLHVPMQIFPLSLTLSLVAYTSFHFYLVTLQVVYIYNKYTIPVCNISKILLLHRFPKAL